MPTTQSVVNNFTQGLKTENTGLNFPENACTDTSNCVFSLVGNVTRRLGFDFEDNFFINNPVDRTNSAISYYRWMNAGGMGNTQVLVIQIGATLYFYLSSSATTALPLSTTRLDSTVDLNSFLATGSSFTLDFEECQYSDGNGYLFVYHPNLDPFYCVLDDNEITTTKIDVKIRDFSGVVEGTDITFRPTSLTSIHKYNLQNQGWTTSPTWSFSSTTTSMFVPSAGGFILNSGNNTFNGTSGLSIVAGTAVSLGGQVYGRTLKGTSLQTGLGGLTGIVISYSGSTLVINVASPGLTLNADWDFVDSATWGIIPSSQIGQIGTWNTAIGNYPSNADVWWAYKNSSDAFSPATTLANVPIATTPAPKGFYTLSAFSQKRTAISGVSGISDVVTVFRPRTGAWFQGRVWYAGVDSSVTAGLNQGFYSWSENIYFSQTVVDPTNFGKCHQNNDPTDQSLFDLLPTDGGVIRIQGCGSVYKLFSIQNGMLVFAANGIWFITGSQGIGFSANDYTITKISSVQSISSTSFVDVQGLPMFWNNEGIYRVAPGQQGGLQVEPITVGTILSFYNSIPLSSKRFARGDYDPLNYVVQWTYSSTPESDINDRYKFDSFLNYNVFNKAFYPFVIDVTSLVKVHGLVYVHSRGDTGVSDPTFKYITTSPADAGKPFRLTFAEEKDTNYVDWESTETSVDYTSFFVTGYRLKGQALRLWNPEYLYVYENNDVDSYPIGTAYTLQGIWDYAVNTLSNKFTTIKTIINPQGNFGVVFRKHRMRGHGIALQFKVSSVTGLPFDLIGWSVWETSNTKV